MIECMALYELHDVPYGLLGVGQQPEAQVLKLADVNLYA